MTVDQISIFAILLALLAGFIWGRLRFDVLAFLALLVSVLLGLVPAGEAFSGFGHPATITVAAILVLSHAVQGSGAMDWVARVIRPSLKSHTLHVGALSGLAGTLSAFMNNVGTLGLLMPVALRTARKAKHAPSMILMPLSFACILGGLTTLVGTPPNVIIANYRSNSAGEPFGMFDFTPVGLPVAIAGIVFVTLIGWRLVPRNRRARADTEELFSIEDYMTELVVPEESTAVGRTLGEIDESTRDIDVMIVSLIRGEHRVFGAMRQADVRPGDILKLEGAKEEIDKFMSKLELAFPNELDPADEEKAEDEEKAGEGEKKEKGERSEDKSLMEAVIAPGSMLDGRLVGEQRLFTRRGVGLLAVSRQGQPFRGRLRNFNMRVGDVLLLHGEAESLPPTVRSLGCLPLSTQPYGFGRRTMGPMTIGIFALAIAAATIGLVNLPIALGLAVVALVILNVLPVREIYQGIDWPVIVLLGSLIPVGNALETTGATEVIAGGILDLTSGLQPAIVLALIMIVTMTLSDMLNNAATAVVMAPIAVTIAERLETNADTFLMGVAVAASCAFLTPIGHQNNALVMGPGGYRFGDYWRMGLPVEIIIVAVAVPLILLVWPLSG